MNAHQLAKILLKGNDHPVVIRSKKDSTHAENIININVLQDCDSPFEYAILLEGSNPIDKMELIDIIF